ncbi:hypothetical protein [Caulobacter sp. Root1472]|uniref:hypothetical protein n=1 Tax=Caulobacter sp. Root1472 TaxID=1736470 RepID=UPI0012E364BA|nr:hypothetical protein [Caulobacter sp. Root1472]
MDPRTGRLASLQIWCACGYSVTWPRAVIVAKAGAWKRPSELRMAVRCSACGAKGPPKVRISGSYR